MDRFPFREALPTVLGFVGAIAVVLVWALPFVQHSDSNCDAEAFLTSPGKQYTVTAERVYVNPKTGRHQVFGVFVLPKSIEQWSPALLTVDDIGVYCSRVQRYNGDYDGIVAGQGSVLMLDFVRTRTAIGLFLQGKLNRIRDRTTWHYTYKLKS
jgi:hypothetical protein